MGKVRAVDIAHPLRATLRDQREASRQAATASKFALSGLSVTAPAELTMYGDFIVTGDFTATGKINNDALSDPVIPGVVNLVADTFALTASFSEKVGVTLTVPAGCSRLLASTSVWMSAYNTNTSGGADGTGTDYLYCYARIGATSGQYNPTGVSGNGGTASCSAGYGQLITGLTPGGTIRVGAWCASQYTTIPSSAFNYVTLTGTLTWLR